MKFGHKTPETNMKPVFFPLWGGFKRMSSGDIQHAPDFLKEIDFHSRVLWASDGCVVLLQL